MRNTERDREQESEKHMFLINASSFRSSNNNSDGSVSCYGSMNKYVCAYLCASDSKITLCRFILYVVYINICRYNNADILSFIDPIKSVDGSTQRHIHKWKLYERNHVSKCAKLIWCTKIVAKRCTIMELMHKTDRENYRVGCISIMPMWCLCTARANVYLYNQCGISIEEQQQKSSLIHPF